MQLKDKVYTFITEDGSETLSYSDYLSRPDLMVKIRDKRRLRLFLGKTILSYDRLFLKTDKAKLAAFRELQDLYDANPLRYFVPSGDAAVDFINDTEHSVTGVIAGNRWGKSTSAFIRTILRTIPCDPSWPIFKESGIKFYDWEGPKVVGIASYEFTNHKTTIWPQVVRKWMPKNELGEYAAGKSKIINWRDTPCLRLACGSEIYFFAYSQAQGGAFESQAVDIWMWDEQGQEHQFDGANERTRTRDGIHIFSLTPHRVDGRPDTGAGSWIHKLYTGETTKGHKVKFYHGSVIDDVPDWVYSEEQKKSAIHAWITEPTERNDIKRLREGQSRLYGQWHESSGLVFDEWQREVHVIDIFDIPKQWTKYRAIDHGTRNPTACLCFAVAPSGEVFIYREYYKAEKTIGENARGIVEMCGNELRKIDLVQSKNTGFFYERFDEVQSKERFYKTLFDSRSFSQPDAAMGMTIAQVYRNMGLFVSPASGKKTTDTIPIAKEMLRIDFNKKHFISKLPGAPKIYVFSTCNNLIREIESYVSMESKRAVGNNPSENPRKLNDHLIDCLLYGIQAPLVYIDGFGETGLVDYKEDEGIIHRRNVDKFCGY